MSDRATVRRGCDELAETYAERRAADGREVVVLDSFLGSLSEPDRVLDAGCGHGTPVLRRLSGEAVAVGLDATREQLRGAGFRLTDGWEAPEPDGDGPRPPFFAARLDG